GAARITRAVLGDVRRARTRGVEPRNRTAVRAQHLAIARHARPAEREADVGALAARELDRRKRRLLDRNHPLVLLVELRVNALRRALVVVAQRLLERALGHAQPALHLGDRLPRVDHLVPEQRPREDLLVDDQIGLAARLLRGVDARARVIGVFGHEAPAQPIDQDALDQLLGRIERRRDQRAVPLQEHAARGRAELVPGAVVVGRVLARDPRLEQARRVAREHLLVAGEVARGEDYAAARADRLLFVEALRAHTDDPIALAHEL